MIKYSLSLYAMKALICLNILNLREEKYMSINEKQHLTISKKIINTLDEPQVIKHYRACLDFDKLCSHYQTKYDISQSEVTILRDKIQQIIHNNFDIHSLPDPYFIYQDAILLAYSVKQELKTAIYIENIIKRLIQMHEQSSTLTLTYFQNQLGFDMKAFLIEMYIHYALVKPSIQDVIRQDTYIQQLLHTYKQDSEFYSDLQAALLTCYGASADPIKNKKKCDTLLEQYPHEPYFVYFSILHGLIISGDYSLISTYYKEALQYQATTPLELSFQQQLTQLFNISKQKEDSNEHKRFN